MPPVDKIIQPLLRSFYERNLEIVAREPLGKLLIRQYAGGEVVGRIQETEVYLGERDIVSHAYHGKSPFDSVLFGPAGHTDVYLIYGLPFCMNVSCLRVADTASAKGSEMTRATDMGLMLPPRLPQFEFRKTDMIQTRL
jgi:3-methyladenine DNA glycosylase Mpg